MKKMLITTALVAFALAGAAPAGTTTISDGEFLDEDWTTTVLIAGQGGTGSFARQETGGNPGAYREHTIDVLPETAVAIVGVWNDFRHDPATDGPIGSIDYLEDARLSSGEDEGMFSFPLVRQDGKNYVVPGITTPETDWTPKQLLGLDALDFVRLDDNLAFVPAEHPDFTPNGSVLEIGYVRMVAAEIAVTRVVDLDNWSMTLDTVGTIGACGAGQVNLGCGPRTDVLFLNGSTGGVEREIVVAHGTPLSGTIVEPPLHIGDGRDTDSVIYAWLGEPGPTDLVILPRSLGPMCFGPFITSTRNPKKIWNSIGIVSKLGMDNGPGAPPKIIDGTPFEFLALPNGLSQSVTATFQGIVEDRCTQGTLDFSVTNGWVLRIQ